MTRKIIVPLLAFLLLLGGWASQGFALSLDEAVDAIAAHMINDRPLKAPRNNVAVMRFSAVSGGETGMGDFLDVHGSIHAPMNIREFSHLSITLSPDNPHYGIRGDYANCLHYLSDQENYSRCKTGSGLPYGEQTEEDSGLFRRLTFNPFFKELTRSIDRFFDGLE